MAESTQYTCDICGAIKGATNHWWVGWTQKLDDKTTYIAIGPWDVQFKTHRLGGQQYHQEAPISPIIHICGQACALRRLEKFMAEGESSDRHLVRGVTDTERP